MTTEEQGNSKDEGEKLSRLEKRRIKAEAKAVDVPGGGTVAKVARDVKKRKVRVTVLPQGGQPYEEDVTPKDTGEFDVSGGGTHRLSRGSVWQGKDGLVRTIALEGQIDTFNWQQAQADPVAHPDIVHGIAHNNLIEQKRRAMRTKNLQQVATYGLVLVGVGALFMMLWAILAISGNLEALGEVIKNLDINVTNYNTGNQTAAEAAGHRAIATGGK